MFPARAGMNRRILMLCACLVFPARAGMNRGADGFVTLSHFVFPARAGMNRPDVIADQLDRVFPARAGMNRVRVRLRGTRRVPRPRGDEPKGWVASSVLRQCSPPARG